MIGRELSEEEVSEVADGQRYLPDGLRNRNRPARACRSDEVIGLDAQETVRPVCERPEHRGEHPRRIDAPGIEVVVVDLHYRPAHEVQAGQRRLAPAEPLIGIDGGQDSMAYGALRIGELGRLRR